MEKLDKIIKNKIFTYTLLFILMLGLIVALCPKAMQNDVFWSIKVGEKLVKEGVWEIDTFSQHEGLKYVAHHFLTDVVIYIVHLVGDFTALYILEIVLTIIMAILLYILNKEICKNKLLSYFFLAIQMFLLKPFIAVRAQMFSYILFILELILLERSRKKEKLWHYILLGAIPVILANFHMGVVPFYFIILGVYIIDTLKIKFLWIQPKTEVNIKRFKKLRFIFLSGMVTIFINPYGLDGVIYPFKTLGNEVINSNISEFQPFALASASQFYVIAYLFMTILIFICNRETVELKDMLLLLGTLLMNFLAFRYTSLYIICSTVILKYLKNVLANLKFEKADKISFAIAGLVCIFILSGNMFVYNDSEYVVEEVAPVQAVEFLKDNIDANTVIFNEYEWGGYMMFRNIPVFIDSRCDLYTTEYNEHTTVAKDYMDLKKCVGNYKEILNKYDFEVFLARKEDSFTTLLSALEEYEQIYEDEMAVIYKKINN